MRKRSSVLAVLAATAVLATPAAASAATGTHAAGTSGASAAKTFTFRGMTLKIPSGWKVHRERDYAVVVTGACRYPDPFLPNCKGFWVFGPKAITRVPVGGGYITYTGKRQFHPFSGVIQCPFSAEEQWYAADRRVSSGLHQVGRGHKAQYSAWANTCVTPSGKKTRSFTQREWFLPTSKILVVDVWNTPGLSTVLKNATWS
ncbi:hypothetical protein ACFOWE_18555 [Planomonospora corallina]|uniref:Uncharacterized protein n=1 Tax=Planomonospora corallina TaxID=1806052 RepID=A0ABV8IBJ7_9ACTN